MDSIASEALCPLQEIGTLSLVCPQTVRKLEEDTNGCKSKITKKHCISAIDLRNSRDHSLFMLTGPTDTQRQIPEFLTGRIHSNTNLERQESTQNVSLDSTLPAPDHEVPVAPKDPLNRLADVLVNLQNKP